MGYDAACTIRFEGKTARGTAFLEHKDLLFRGPFRLAVPLKEVEEVRAVDGTLHVRFGARRAEFDIGSAAPRWAERIAHPPSRLDKLGVKAGQRVILLGVDDAVFRRELDERGAAVTTRAAARPMADAVFFAAHRRADLARLGALAGIIKPDGAVWILRPKGVPAITESDTMAAGKSAGLVDVKVVSFSDALSAEKFVIPVRTRPRVTPEGKRAAPARPSSASPRTRGSSASRGRT